MVRLLSEAGAPRGKAIKEDFARFFEEPTREGLREVLKNNVGEANEIDFKREWPEGSKLAKHVLGLANHGGGGCIVAGVEQTEEGRLEPTGLSDLRDKTELLDGIAAYLPDALKRQVDTLDFSYPDSEYPKLKGRTFQVLFVPDDPQHLPFVAARDGKNVNANVVYIRRNTTTVVADHEELQRIISRRVETGYSSRRELDLREHLEQLRVLYEQLERPDPGGSEGGVGVLLGRLVGGPDLARKMYESSPEGFGKFVWRVIEKKKQLIESELDV
jgi:hypothetical protein